MATEEAYAKLDTLPPWRALDTRGTAPKWGARFDPPEIGAAVVVTVNGCGPGVVVGYFTQGGYLGARVRLTSPPDWYVKQNGAAAEAHAFGTECRLADAPWFVCRLRTVAPRTPWGRGFETLGEAWAFGLGKFEAGEAAAFVVFNGQPSDGARVVARFDPDGLPDV